MPEQSAAAAAWDGAPPVSENGFTFVHGELFAEASGQNRHRRATVAELKARVATGSDKEKPAHWFEAQLVHYGLKPSKTKAVARMRLLDAVNAGDLTVPEHVSKLEAKLKKQWTKNDRDLKKKSSTKGPVMAETKKATAATKKSAGVKRKAEDSPPAATSSTGTAQNNAKKAKTSASKAGSSSTSQTKATAPKTKAATPKAKKTSTPKTTASTKATKTRAKTTVAKTETDTPPPQKKQTARRGGHSQGPVRGAFATTSQPLERSTMPKQTARRSSGFVGRARIPDPPPAWAYEGIGYGNWSGSDGQDFDEDGFDQDDSDQDDSDEDTSDIVLAPLGLLNGRYNVSCKEVESGWDVGSDFSLNLTLEGSSLWGSFDLGILEGVLFFDERPWQSSHESIPFTWRGSERDGPIFYGDSNRGWMKFFGDGRVEGWVDFSSITFRGNRLKDQGTRGARTANSLRDEWDNYSEDQYEYERQARWR